MLRSGIPPERVSVIPNAVDAIRFQPDLSRRQAGGRITVGVTARLAYRKGMHLLASVIPMACKRQGSATGSCDWPRHCMTECV